MADETVLCFKKSYLDGLGLFQGVSFLEKHFGSPVLDGYTFWNSRAQAEQDPEIKQVIPYVLVFRGDSILRYRRTKLSGESRLHGQRSIGFGGHVSYLDGHAGRAFSVAVSPVVAVDNCIGREIKEELGISYDVGHLKSVGAVNTDATPVGQVHYGMIFVLQIPDDVDLKFSDEVGEPE